MTPTDYFAKACYLNTSPSLQRDAVILQRPIRVAESLRDDGVQARCHFLAAGNRLHDRSLIAIEDRLRLIGRTTG